VDEDWLMEQQDLLVQVVECVAATALRHAPFSGAQRWGNSFAAAAASSAASSCMLYMAALTCGHLRIDCTVPCSLDACDVSSHVSFSMKQPKQSVEVESITAHALLLLYHALLYQGPLALALRSTAAVQLLRLTRYIRFISHFHWLKDFSVKLLAHCQACDDECNAVPIVSCACVAVAVIRECQDIAVPSSVLRALSKLTESSIVSHRLTAISCFTALVEAGCAAALTHPSPINSSISALEAVLSSPWAASTHPFADASILQQPPADPSHHSCITVAKLYKAVFACKKHLKSSPRLQASMTRLFHDFFRTHVLQPCTPLQLLSYVVTCVYPEGGERVRCMIERQHDIVAGCGIRRFLLLCDGAFCRWPVLVGSEGGSKDLLHEEATQLLAALRTTSPLETIGVNFVCRSLLQQLDAEQRVILMLGEALNDGWSSSFEGVVLQLRWFVENGDFACRTFALRMCSGIMALERDALARRTALGSSSTAVPRLQLVAAVTALSMSGAIRGALEWSVASISIAVIPLLDARDDDLDIFLYGTDVQFTAAFARAMLLAEALPAFGRSFW
jgi:hypothetical protein